MSFFVIIKGKRAVADGLEIDMGTCAPGQSWTELPLPPCPDCGGDLLWWEAGYVPGTRKCLGKPIRPNEYDADGGCGSLFSVKTGPRISLRREKFYQP